MLAHLSEGSSNGSRTHKNYCCWSGIGYCGWSAGKFLRPRKIYPDAFASKVSGSLFTDSNTPPS